MLGRKVSEHKAVNKRVPRRIDLRPLRTFSFIKIPFPLLRTCRMRGVDRSIRGRCVTIGGNIERVSCCGFFGTRSSVHKASVRTSIRHRARCVEMMLRLEKCVARSFSLSDRPWDCFPPLGGWNVLPRFAATVDRWATVRRCRDRSISIAPSTRSNTVPFTCN